MIESNIAICGAGIVGLTIARELVSRGHDGLIVLDKEPDLARHASGRNSGVLHAGIYYTPGSTRAQTCLEGNRLMQAYCRDKGLPLNRSGKVIVATSYLELEALDRLYRRTRENGSPVELLDEATLEDIEPNARTVEKAIYSPETAVVNPRLIVESIRQNLVQSGKVRFFFNSRVHRRSGRNRVETAIGPVDCKLFVNASGAHSDRIASSFGISSDYRLLPFKGVYRQLRPEAASMVRGNIYPVPDIRNPFLGIHFTRSIEGTVYLGPTAIPALGRENYGLIEGMDWEAPSILALELGLFLTNPRFRSIATTEPKKYLFSHFYRDASRLVKQFSLSDLMPSKKVGIRPQLINMKTKELVMDYLMVRGEKSVHILNAISPAFTSSMAFARIVADEIAATL